MTGVQTCALPILAVASGRRLDSPLFAGGETLGNLWCLLVGQSATARKTTCLNLITAQLAQVAPTLVCGKPGSGPGLLKRLAAHPITLMELGEMGDFLAATASNNGVSFYSQVKESCTKFFDGKSEETPYSKEVIHVRDPRFSIVAACAPPFLADHTVKRDWEGGFYSRFLMICTDSERNVKIGRAHV